MSPTVTALLLAFAGGVATPVPSQAQIYSWRDARGNLVLSDRPPDGARRTYAVAETAGVRATRPVATARATAVDDVIRRHAATHGVDPNLVRAVIQVESAFNPRAVSRKGAMGLMQLMPATATEFGVMNPFDPSENVRAGVAYLRRLLDRYDNRVELALAAYNAGPGAVDRHGAAVPPYRETRDYVRKVASVTAIRVGPSRTIYKIVEIIDGREVPRYSDRRPDGDFEVVTAR